MRHSSHPLHPSRGRGNWNRIVRNRDRRGSGRKVLGRRAEVLRAWATSHCLLPQPRRIENPGKLTWSRRPGSCRRSTRCGLVRSGWETGFARGWVPCCTWRLLRSQIRRLCRRRGGLTGSGQGGEGLRPDPWFCHPRRAHGRYFHARSLRLGRLIQHLNQARNAGSAHWRRALERVRLRQRRGRKWIVARLRRPRRLRRRFIIEASR